MAQLFLIISLAACNGKEHKKLLMATKWRPTVDSYLKLASDAFSKKMPAEYREELKEKAKTIIWIFKPDGMHESYVSGEKEVGTWSLRGSNTLMINDLNSEEETTAYKIKKITSTTLVLEVKGGSDFVLKAID